MLDEEYCHKCGRWVIPDACMNRDCALFHDHEDYNSDEEGGYEDQ